MSLLLAFTAKRVVKGVPTLTSFALNVRAMCWPPSDASPDALKEHKGDFYIAWRFELVFTRKSVLVETKYNRESLLSVCLKRSPVSCAQVRHF